MFTFLILTILLLIAIWILVAPLFKEIGELTHSIEKRIKGDENICQKEQ